jgi:hypothetical protein
MSVTIFDKQTVPKAPVFPGGNINLFKPGGVIIGEGP